MIMSAKSSLGPTIKTTEYTTAMTRARTAMSAAEQRLQQGEVQQATGEVARAIHELIVLHGALLETSLARSRWEHADERHYEEAPRLALGQIRKEEIH